MLAEDDQTTFHSLDDISNPRVLGFIDGIKESLDIREQPYAEWELLLLASNYADKIEE